MENGINRLFVYGDSILKGAVTGTGSGHLFDITKNDSLSLAQKTLGFELNNKSVFGNIITKGMHRLERDIERGEFSADLAVIEFGGNDCDYDWGEVCKEPLKAHTQRVPSAQFMETLDAMVRLCREHRVTPFLMTMPPLVIDRWHAHICRGYDAEKVALFTGNAPEVLYRNHEAYSTRILKYCYENNVQFADMRLRFAESPQFRDLMCTDGIHPNEKGYAFMAEIWRQELPKIKAEFPPHAQ
ncbi:MAG: SGNH/GDSL hydrolase family protein [Treponema sp.]|nr:SGNH/GDSL hydrolase family protein [Treponema sp.]